MASQQRKAGVPTMAAVAAGHQSMSGGTLYLSYGMASVKGRRPALTDAVVAMPSFSPLSPEMPLDYFAVVDGRFGEAVAGHLREQLGFAIANQIAGELLCEAPRFLAGSADVVGWWRTTIRAAFQDVEEEAVGGGAVVGDDAATAGATALVALVHESYVVVGNNGGSSAVVSRAGGEVVQLMSEQRANRTDETQGAEHSGAAAGSSPSNPGVVTEPEVAAVERTPRDEFLLLASDGLWEAVTPPAACAFVRRRLLTRITMP
ncbi:hypothetical protein ACP4OV_020753 [Aristida adscensionis]